MHTQYENRSWWMVILLHIGLRIRYIIDSWCYLKPFLVKNINSFPHNEIRPKNAPSIGYWPTLAFKILWYLGAFFRQSKIIAIPFFLCGFYALVKFLHGRLEKYVLNILKKQYPKEEDMKKFRGIQIPEFDWKNEDPKKFFETYMKRPHPVVLRGFMKDTELLNKLTFDEVIKNHGELDVLLTSKKEDGYLGKLKEVENANTYIHNSEVIFKKNPYIIKLLQCEKLIKFVDRFRPGFSQLFIGKYGTGTGFHNAHSYNFFYMIDGKKQWYFIDPNDSPLAYPFYMAGTPAGILLTPFVDKYEEETFPLFKYCPYYTTVLEPGDILFNPPWWWHSIKNISEKTVAIATRWHIDGITGSTLRMNEESYDINSFASLCFFSGIYSFGFLQGSLREPSPSYDEDFTMREKHSRFYSKQLTLAYKPGLRVFGSRLTV